MNTDKIRILLAIFTLSTSLHMAAPGQARLTVKVNGIRNSEGMVRIALYRNEEDFLNNACVAKALPANSGSLSFSFENLPSFSYAISVIHDANKNGELDKNILGIPKEGFGFGNDSMGMFGPPSFEEAGLRLEAMDLDVEVNLRYY